MKNLFYIISLFLLANYQLHGQQTNLNDSLYYIQDNVLVKTTDGTLVSAMVVTRKDAVLPLPVIFQYTIYVSQNRDILSLKLAADRGYAGVIAYTRGKKNSLSEIIPYEFDGRDANDVIDWISKQGWCNGKIGMYGGSYNGFTQWAAAKYKHPALKTIIPIVAAIPGMGLPMENNIFINPNYQWAFYVTNNKTLDDSVNNDYQRFNRMQEKWFESGVAYRKIDSIDGTPNKWLQRWLLHPAYDKYWQDMIPYKNEYATINIPVLSIDGYYNDSQISNLHYLREHAKYNANADDYLIIGPYGHFGAQVGGDSIINGYKVDDVALIGVRNIRYQWFDYILKGGKKPAILKDKINYQVMGTNSWKNASSLEKMSNQKIIFFLSEQKQSKRFQLSSTKPKKQGFVSQKVNFADRKSENGGFYPSPIIQEKLDVANGIMYVSEPLNENVEINGAFDGQLKISVNKKDVDISVALYEQLPNGQTFQLSYFVGRASYAKDMTSRNLLSPNKIEEVPITNSRLVSKKLSKGSRLAIVIGVIKLAAYQVNHGTGKDVSDETIADAKEQLHIKFYNDSYIQVPIWK
jgi:uncharacterized protein